MSDTKKYWKALAELHESPEFLQSQLHEFAEELPVEGLFSEASQKMGVSRRDFLKFMGFGLAAVSAACSRVPVKKAVPYLNKPEEITPGKSLWYASTCANCTAACGVLVKNRDGRPIKLEGLPQSPISRGGLCATGQAGVLSLYDSGRLHGPQIGNAAASWSQVDKSVSAALQKARDEKKSVHVLSHTMISPASREVVQKFVSGFSGGKHFVYDAVSAAAFLDVHDKAFGKRALPRFNFEKADLVVAIEADFLGGWISPVEHAKGYAGARRITDAKSKVMRHVQFESRLSLSGASADTRWSTTPSQLHLVVLSLLQAVRQAKGVSLPAAAPKTADAALATNVAKTAQELLAHAGKSLVMCGINDASLQAAVLEINTRLGNYGTTLDMDAPSYQKQGRDTDLQDLIKEMAADKVGVLVVYGANPAYDSFLATEFAAALKKVGMSISLKCVADETAALCNLMSPDHHFLENWGDANPVAGVWQLQQPVINPVYDTRAAQDSLLIWAAAGKTFADYLKSYWQENVFPKQSQFILFDSFWTHCVREGVELQTTVSNGRVSPSGDVSGLITASSLPATAAGFELSVYESVALRDGAVANNPWLQELPDPLTKITWDNALTISSDDAQKLGVIAGDVVGLKVGRVSLEVPAYILPGQARGSASLALGYGRTRAGKVGNGVGVNAYPLTSLRNGYGATHLTGVHITKTGKHHDLACTQTHSSYEGRDIVREMTLAELARGKVVGHAADTDASGEMLWKDLPSGQHKWGMAIDMSACTGCSACLIGCQSENNVAVVGREEVFLRREMHWIRLDRYFSGNENNPETVFQPMMCQHCGHAPCESVCPVAATLHSSDGLNQQVYNRCVGTRYCANNCPYKVRRFNWFDYANNPRFDYYMNDDVGKLVLNPDIVVRTRGVMEKCSMCVQRIQEGKLQAKLEGRPLADGDIKLACEQSCPTDAIVFGNLADKESRASKMIEKNPRRYRVLAELNVEPAINYLAKVRNRPS